MHLSRRVLSASVNTTAYRVELLAKFGVEIQGLDLVNTLKTEIEASRIAANLKSDLDKHGLLLFRGQHALQPEHHVGVSKWLGEVFPIPPRYQHPKSPHPDIMRVSNSAADGFTGVGASAWHIDGVTYDSPFGHCLFHIIETPERGATHFLPLDALAQRLLDNGLKNQENQENIVNADWHKFWVRFQGSGETDLPVHHPLIYAHPRTQSPGVCVHRIRSFVLDPNADAEVATDPTETKVLHSAINSHIEALADDVYKHDWQAGDLVIIDNLAIAHLASADSQEPTKETGLRVLHRVCTAGPDSALNMFSF